MNKVAYTAQGTRSHKFDRVSTMKHQDDMISSVSDTNDTWKGFVFTVGLAIVAGYLIVNYLIPLIAK